MRRALFLLSFIAVLLPASMASAQDIRALIDRVDRLQRDIDTLQRQVYRGGPVPNAPIGAPLPPLGGSGGDLSAGAINRFETRITQLEDTLRDLTGKIEEISYANEQTRRQMEKLSSDNEVRFKQLEQGRPGPAQAQGQAPAAPPVQPPAGTAGPAPATTSGQPRQHDEGQLQANAPTPPPRGQATPGRPAAPTPPPQQSARPPVASILPDGSPEDQ